MDDITRILGEEGSVFCEIKRLKEQRKEAEKRPKPEQRSKAEWKLNQDKLVEAKAREKARNLVNRAHSEIVSVYSDEGLIERVNSLLEKEMLSERKLLLPFIQESLESMTYGKEMESYNRLTGDLDNAITMTIQNIPKPFSPSLINVDKRFPFDRVAQTSDGRYYDVWLTNGLKSKPIFFDASNYDEKRMEFYEKVYWPAGLREKEEEVRQSPQPPTEKPHVEQPISQTVLYKEFYSIGQEAPAKEEGEIRSKIYGGRR